jgi:hypothetical protein
MQNLPKIVRTRLKVAMPPGGHPDADVLTAFAERLLPQSERAFVMEHLSRCADCREVVALASDASTVEVAAAGRPVRGSWLTWPALRWGFVTVGLVAIASVGIVLYRNASRPTTVVSRNVASNDVSQTAKPSPAPPTAAPPARAQEEAAATTRRKEVPGASSAPPAALASAALNGLREGRIESTPGGTSASVGGRKTFHGTVAGIGSGSGSGFAAKQPSSAAGAQRDLNSLSTGAGAWRAANAGQAAKPAPPPAVPRATQMVEVQSESAAVQTTTADQAQGQLSQNYVVPLQGRSVTELETVEKSKPAPAAPAAATLGGPLANQRAFALKAIAPRWTISPAGGLQRSLDGGNTWQDVPVVANPASVANLLQAEVAKKSKDQESKLKQEVAAPVFRAVAANGADVWAGGSAGVLYHSTDTGEHWTRVVPSVGGIALTGDILSVEFLDPHNGKVITSTSETWITHDAGQSWQKQ